MVRKIIIAICAAAACFLLGWQTGRLLDREPAALVAEADKFLNQVQLPGTIVPPAATTVPKPESVKNEPLAETEKGEGYSAQSTGGQTANKNKAKATPKMVNINQAGVEELESLPGIGPALARRIVDYRQQHGPFTDKEQLLAVPGIGPKKMAELRPWLKL